MTAKRKIKTKNVTIRNMRIEDWEFLYLTAKQFDITMADIIHYFVEEKRVAAKQSEKWVHFWMGLTLEQRKAILKYSTNIMPKSPIRENVKMAYEKLDKLQTLPYEKVKAYIKLKHDMTLEDFLNLNFYATEENMKRAKREMKKK